MTNRDSKEVALKVLVVRFSSSRGRIGSPSLLDGLPPSSEESGQLSRDAHQKEVPSNSTGRAVLILRAVNLT